MIKHTMAFFTAGIIFCASAMADDTKFGKDFTLKDKTKVSDVLKEPDKFVGKNILIEGKIIDVCTERGCWMKVSSDKKGENLRIKVQDGEMVFPVAARGKSALIEGEIVKVTFDKAEAEEAKKDGMAEKHDHKHEGKSDEAHKHEHKKEVKKPIYLFKPKAVLIK